MNLETHLYVYTLEISVMLPWTQLLLGA